MRLSVFSPQVSPQLLIDLAKLYSPYFNEQQLTPEGLQVFIEDADKLLFVTMFNARHLGAVQVEIHQQEAQLLNLCVRDITRRRGVGKNLLREVEKQLKEKKITTISLLLSDVGDDEKASLHSFMESCGYHLKGQYFSKHILR